MLSSKMCQKGLRTLLFQISDWTFLQKHMLSKFWSADPVIHSKTTLSLSLHLKWLKFGLSINNFLNCLIKVLKRCFLHCRYLKFEWILGFKITTFGEKKLLCIFLWPNLSENHIIHQYCPLLMYSPHPITTYGEWGQFNITNFES
jgi:hypothetical protein